MVFDWKVDIAVIYNQDSEKNSKLLLSLTQKWIIIFIFFFRFSQNTVLKFLK